MQVPTMAASAIIRPIPPAVLPNPKRLHFTARDGLEYGVSHPVNQPDYGKAPCFQLLVRVMDQREYLPKWHRSSLPERDAILDVMENIIHKTDTTRIHIGKLSMD